MHRFYAPPDQCRENPVRLAAREAHHALHVLRVARGEQVAVLDGVGGELLCEVTDCSRNSLQLSVIRRLTAAPLPYQITLLQAIPKGRLIESIIQKATELGVRRLVPLLSERTTVQLDRDSAASKTAKWQQVAIEAIKQCGSAWLPQIELPATPGEFLNRKLAFELPLIASLQGGARHPRCCFEDFERNHGRPPRTLCVWIGPEGDFSPDEDAAIRAAGVSAVELGPLVLRTETAALYCLSALRYELEWRHANPAAA